MDGQSLKTDGPWKVERWSEYVICQYCHAGNGRQICLMGRYLKHEWTVNAIYRELVQRTLNQISNERSANGVFASFVSTVMCEMKSMHIYVLWGNTVTPESKCFHYVGPTTEYFKRTLEKISPGRSADGVFASLVTNVTWEVDR